MRFFKNDDFNSHLHKIIADYETQQPLTQEIVMTNTIVALNELDLSLKDIKKEILSNGERVSPAKLLMINAMLEMILEDVKSLNIS